MSTSHDPQFGQPNQPSATRGPAAIVWHDQSSGAPSVWTGPAAFGAPEPAAQEQPPAAGSLSSAWASYESAQPSAPEQPRSPEQPPASEQAAQPVGDAPSDEHQQPGAAQAPAQSPISLNKQDQRADAGSDAPQSWVQPGSAPTADEVRDQWNGQHGEMPPSTQEPQQPSAPSADPWAGNGAEAAAPSQPGASAFDPNVTLQPRPDDDEPSAPEGAYDPYAQAPAGNATLQHSVEDEDRAPQWPNEANEQPGNSWQGDPAPQNGNQPWGQSAAQEPASAPAAAPSQTSGGSSQASAASDDDEALTIGRGRDNAIVLDDMLVSRQHLRITADDQGLLLEDLGSRNGTYVNGRRVERSHLQEGDRIGVGSTTFEVRDGWLVTI